MANLQYCVYFFLMLQLISTSSGLYFQQSHLIFIAVNIGFKMVYLLIS